MYTDKRLNQLNDKKSKQRKWPNNNYELHKLILKFLFIVL
jgi:hypothetical protein